MGRPSEYSDKVAGAICEKIAEGQSLRAICLAEDMPNKATVFRWLADPDRQSFRDQYARAREAQADALFDEILHIADNTLEGVKTKTLPDGKVEKTTGDMIEHRRLQVDARKWMAGKLQPKKYGDKLELSGNPDAPLIPVLNVSIGKTGPGSSSEAG